MTARATVRRWGRLVLDYLPRGHSLPEDAWRVRHRTLSYLLRAHVVGVFLFGLLREQGPLHSATEAAVVGLFACAGWAGLGHRQFSSAVTAVGLVASSAVLVHLSGGVIEMHFHFFVMVGILTLYQDWLPFLLAVAFVVVHHGVLGSLAPGEVYNHPAAVAQPFRWALVHGAFVLAASAASVVAWKLNEEQGLKDALTRLPKPPPVPRPGGPRPRPQPAGGDAWPFCSSTSTGSRRSTTRWATRAGTSCSCWSPSVSATWCALGHRGPSGRRRVRRARGGRRRRSGGRLRRRTAAHRRGRPFVVRGTEVTVGASVGIALGAPGTTLDELLMNADTAMYAAKAEGRVRYRVFHMEPIAFDPTGARTPCTPTARRPDGSHPRVRSVP